MPGKGRSNLSIKKAGKGKVRRIVQRLQRPGFLKAFDVERRTDIEAAFSAAVFAILFSLL